MADGPSDAPSKPERLLTLFSAINNPIDVEEIGKARYPAEMHARLCQTGKVENEQGTQPQYLVLP